MIKNKTITSLKASFFMFSMTVAATAMTHEKAKSPNFLFIIADDLRPELGCYGEKHIISPNIDKIAADGVVFTNSFVQYAVCAGSRASFLTGCRPATTGVGYPYSRYFTDVFLKSHPSIQQYMFDNGYYTRTLGKVHHGFSENLSENHISKTMLDYNLRENIAIQQDSSLRPAFEFADYPDGHYTDGKMANEAIATIQRATATGKSFFIALGFMRPHLPWVAPKKYLDMYDTTKIPPCPFPEPTRGETEFSRSFGNLIQFGGESNVNRHIISPGRSQELRRAYSACVTFVDAMVGKVVDELKKKGNYENTVIILIGDNGWHLGDNGMWGKQTNFERATRVPLIVKTANDKKRTGYISDKLIELVDLYPTICELAKLPAPEYIEGLSFLPLLSNGDLEWKKGAFSEHPRGDIEGKTIRTERYRYVEWRAPKTKTRVGQELYDHKADPLETTNIASGNSELCRELSKMLHLGWEKALPPGRLSGE